MRSDSISRRCSRQSMIFKRPCRLKAAFKLKTKRTVRWRTYTVLMNKQGQKAKKSKRRQTVPSKSTTSASNALETHHSLGKHLKSRALVMPLIWSFIRTKIGQEVNSWNGNSNWLVKTNSSTLSLSIIPSILPTKRSLTRKRQLPNLTLTLRGLPNRSKIQSTIKRS